MRFYWPGPPLVVLQASDQFGYIKLVRESVASGAWLVCLPDSFSRVDDEMVTLFPVSLSVSVIPVMDPSSGSSPGGSHDVGKPPRHFVTHTVWAL